MAIAYVPPFVTAFVFVSVMTSLVTNVIGATSTDAVEPPKAVAGDFAFIDNGQIRLGIKKSSGGGIAFFSQSKTRRNLVDHYDRGRLVQQSYYGIRDGSRWAGKPWRWNPVQGGSYKGKPAKLLALKIEKEKLYARTRAVHWATGDDLDDVIMEQWIRLNGEVAHVRFKMTYSGKTKHPRHNQEIPAVFMDRHLGTLALYNGDQPWTGQAIARLKPGGKNENHRIAENWAAYIDDKDFGLGVYVPIAKEITSYRVAKPGQRGACSYFAPVTSFAIQPGHVFEYDLYLSIGKIDQIRQRFGEIARKAKSK